MTDAPSPDPSRRRLPLTEQASARPAAPSGDEAMIARLVDAFYAAIREDEVLGPIFARHVQDWPTHLAKMCDFWSTIILKSGRYSGRPVLAHQKIAELSPANFERWLGLWSDVVDAELPAAARAPFKTAARRMARSMSEQLLEEPEEEADGTPPH